MDTRVVVIACFALFCVIDAFSARSYFIKGDYSEAIWKAASAGMFLGFGVCSAVNIWLF